MTVPLGQLVLPGAPMGGYAPASGTPVFGGSPAIQSFVGVAPTDVTVGALRMDTLEPVGGAALSVYAVAQDGTETLVAEGETDADGRAQFFAEGVPSSQVLVYRFIAEPGSSGLSFPPASVEGPPNRTYVINPPICPVAADRLACEVGEKQIAFAKTHQLYMEQWGGNRAFALRMAHAEIRNMAVADQRLERYFNYKSWGVADLGIPPTDWPEIVQNEKQMARVLDGVPWPSFPGEADKIGQYFKACALGVGLIQGRDGNALAPNNWRLYSPTWSDYFPRSDRQIRYDLASRWLLNMKPVLACVEHRIKKKAREVERSAKMFSTLGLTTAMLLSPMLGPGGAASVMVTEGYTHLQIANDLEVSAEVEHVLTHSEIFKGNEINASGLLTAVLGAYLATYLAEREDIKPVVKAVIQEAVPGLAELAIDELITGIGLGSDAPAGSVGAEAGTTGAAAGTAVGVAVVKLIAGWVRKQGVQEVKQFGDVLLGLANLQEELVPFYVWAMRTVEVDKTYEAIGREAGIDVDADRDIVGPLVERAEAAGVEVPASALAPASKDAAVAPATTPTEKALALGAIGGGALAIALGTGIIGGS